MKKILFLSLIVSALTAQTEVFKAKFGLSKLVINGDSSVHKWKVETKVIGGFLDVDASSLKKPGKVNSKGTVIVPVRQLKSGKKRMDEVMHAAMNEPKHKLIKFTISTLEIKSVKDNVASCTGNGTIQINGVTKPLTMEVNITHAGDKLTVEGLTPLKMTNFGIKPPSPKLPTGNIITKDEVKISFSWVTVK
jgi:polyisoprenoid-binding protein YceI